MSRLASLGFAFALVACGGSSIKNSNHDLGGASDLAAASDLGTASGPGAPDLALGGGDAAVVGESCPMPVSCAIPACYGAPACAAQQIASIQSGLTPCGAPIAVTVADAQAACASLVASSQAPTNPAPQCSSSPLTATVQIYCDAGSVSRAAWFAITAPLPAQVYQNISATESIITDYTYANMVYPVMAGSHGQTTFLDAAGTKPVAQVFAATSVQSGQPSPGLFVMVEADKQDIVMGGPPPTDQISFYWLGAAQVQVP